MVVRVAVIDRDICTNIKCGYVCEKVCPPNRMGEECIVTEKETVFPVISEPLCIGCGLCVKKCPVSCISIVNLAQELTEPIYQYGTNTFRLYGLPLPMDGAVSLVGKNGIGKTTAIKRPTRQVRPNFGTSRMKFTDDDIDKRLTMDIKRYFAKTREGLKVSVKPQHIDKMRDAFDGTVADLLSKVAGKSKVAQTAKLFKLQDTLERKVSSSPEASSRRSFAASYMKSADIYYFDEVTKPWI